MIISILGISALRDPCVPFKLRLISAELRMCDVAEMCADSHKGFVWLYICNPS